MKQITIKMIMTMTMIPAMARILAISPKSLPDRGASAEASFATYKFELVLF